MDQANAPYLLSLALKASQRASDAILKIYHSGNFETETKEDDSPLTQADRHAHAAILQTLEPSGYPVLSEEGKEIPFARRRSWEYFWLVDPLDGTKEFIKRNGEFTVNIALIHRDHPVLGVVEVPVTRTVYYGITGMGAIRKFGNEEVKLFRREKIDLTAERLRVVASRSHRDEDTENFIRRLNNPELISSGSSLKFMLLAEGNADVYPRFAPTMEWDTAAAHLIVNEVGLKVNRRDSDQELTYNKESLLNPSFIVL